MSGPYETDRQAADPAVRAVYEAFAAGPGAGKMTPLNERMLTGACEAAGVELGAYDRRILTWLADWEPQVCAVVAGLITRAAACAASPECTAQLAEIRGVLEAFDWERDDRQYALERIERIADGTEGVPAGTGPAGVPPAQLSTVLAALDDAATFRTERAEAYCVDCSRHPAGACDSHLDDLDRAEAYKALAAALSGVS